MKNSDENIVHIPDLVISKEKLKEIYNSVFLKEADNKKSDTQCNLQYVSDRIRYDYIKDAKQQEVSDKIPTRKDLLDSDDLVIAVNNGNSISYYELFVDSCWDALFSKSEYEELSKIEAINKLVNERFKKIADLLNETIINWSFKNSILFIKMTNKTKNSVKGIINEEVKSRIKHKLVVEKSAGLTPEKIQMTAEFIKYCCKELGINEPCKVTIVGDRKKHNMATLAYFDPNNKEIFVYGKNRLNADLDRSLSHEIRHLKQCIDEELTNVSGLKNSPQEQECNIFSGNVMRDYAKIEPRIFD